MKFAFSLTKSMLSNFTIALSLYPLDHGKIVCDNTPRDICRVIVRVLLSHSDIGQPSVKYVNYGRLWLLY